MQREQTRARSVRPTTSEHRFWLKVQRGPGCWEWTGGRNRFNYGIAVLQSGRAGRIRQVAHRRAWELTNGPVPEGSMVCHRCDNPPCVRPDHLFIGTAADNNADMRTKGRGYVPQQLPQQGSLNRYTTLNEDDVRAIRVMASYGIRQSVIAGAFDVDRATVSYIVNRHTWKHVA